MRAGRLDRLVTIRQVTTAQDTYGQPIETWTDLDTVWAHRQELRGAEAWQARQVVATVNSKYIIRWRNDVTVLHRLKDGDTEYDIHHVGELGRRDGLELTCVGRAE